MVALKSVRRDRGLLAAVWVLTLVVLVVGIVLVAPILLVWGVIGLLGAAFLTRIHVRDTRAGSDPAETAPAGNEEIEP